MMPARGPQTVLTVALVAVVVVVPVAVVVVAVIAVVVSSSSAAGPLCFLQTHAHFQIRRGTLSRRWSMRRQCFG